MKKKLKKLVLSKETLHSLSLREATGGIVPSNGPEDYSCRCTGVYDDASCVLSCISYCQHC